MALEPICSASNGSCVQGGCHVVDSAYAQHSAMDAKHDAATCLNSICHSGSLTQIHSLASTTTGGVTRTSCNVCHTTDYVPTIPN